MEDKRKDEGGLAVLITAGCLLLAIGLFTLIGISVVEDFRNRQAREQMLQARQRATLAANLARQKALLAATASKSGAAQAGKIAAEAEVAAVPEKMVIPSNSP